MKTAAILAGRFLAVVLVVLIIGPGIKKITAGKRLLWWAGAVVIFLVPVIADDWFHDKRLYGVAMLGLAVYIAVSATFIRR